jgi:hypothetical protein
MRREEGGGRSERGEDNLVVGCNPKRLNFLLSTLHFQLLMPDV